MAIDPSIPLGVRSQPFNNPFAALMAVREEQEQRAEQDQRRRLVDQQIQSGKTAEDERRQRLTAAERLAESTQTIDGLMSKAMVPDPETGIFTFDRKIAEEGIVKSGNGHLLPQYMQHFDALDKSTREAADKNNAAIAKALMVVTTAGNTSGAALGMVAYLKKNRLMSDAHTQQILTELSADESPEAVKALVTKYGEQIPQYRELVNSEEKRKSDLAHTDATTANLAAQTKKLGQPDEPKTLDAAILAARNNPMELNRLLKLKRQEAEAGRDPNAGAANRAPFWVNRGGKMIRITEAEYRPGDLPASTREQGRSVTAGDAEDLANFDTSADELSAVRAAIGPSDSTGIVAQIGAKIPYVTQITGWGTDAKKRQAVIDRVKQVIGKTLEGGVLRKEDEAKYEKILPTIGDPNDVAIAKLDGLEAALVKRKARRLDALKDANYDVTKFEARSPAKPSGSTVRMRAPNGQETDVSPDQVEHYKSRGATVVR